MNFLAHLYLADDSAASMIGSVLPDLVRGRCASDLDPCVLDGARLHRKVDAFTDTHPLFARSRARLRDRHGRYSGILVDMFYDHLLASTWEAHHPLALRAFVEKVHHRFASHRHLMPPRMQAITRRLIEQDWLTSYATYQGMELALSRLAHHLSERFQRPVRLAHAVADLHADRRAFERDFNTFFPHLVTYARSRPQVMTAPATAVPAGPGGSRWATDRRSV